MRSHAFEAWVDENAEWLHGSNYAAAEFWDDGAKTYAHWKYDSINTAWRAWCAALGFVATAGTA